MITEDYVNKEIAKLLKKKGFDWECKTMKYFPEPDYDQESPDGVYAPTLQMAMKWLREVHKVYIDIHTYLDEEPVEYNAICYKDGIYNDTLYYTTEYEDAVNNAIKYALENLI